MQAVQALVAAAGKWRGTNRLHDPHTNKPDDSPGSLTVTGIRGGQFIRIDYTWMYAGQTHEGSMLIIPDPKSGQCTATWADTWHQSAIAMAMTQSAPRAGGLAFVGAYAAPPGPDWGWQIEFVASAEKFQMLMFNITPDGESAPAVEASYSRG